MALDILGPSRVFTEKFRKPFYFEDDEDPVIPQTCFNGTFAIHKPNAISKPLQMNKRTPRQLSATGPENVEGLIPLKSCLYISRGDSGQKVPIKKSKSVHFADTCGLALTSVQPFVDCDYDLEGHRVVKTRKSYPLFESSTGRVLGEREGKSRLINFVQPITRPDFNRRLDTNNISLENVTFREYSIFGTIRVKNISFEKKVTVKYTTDSWETSDSLVADFVPGSSTGNTDCFSFELSAKQEPGEGAVKFEFCVCFDCLGEQFWDNNFGDNYRLICHRKSRPPSGSEKLSGHKFSLSSADSKLIGWAA